VVPYRGVAPALQDVIAGQVSACISAYRLRTTYIPAGKVTRARRHQRETAHERA